MKLIIHVSAAIVLVLFICCAPLLAAERSDERFVEWGHTRWKIEGRGECAIRKESLQLTGCEAVDSHSGLSDYELSFRARAPKNEAQAQIWASVRRTARDSRYAVGIRGGNNNVLIGVK